MPCGTVREIVCELEKLRTTTPAQAAKQVRFADGFGSPEARTHGEGTSLRRVEPEAPPSPTATVSASLLASSEGMNRGLQKTNDRLHEDLVELEVKSDRLNESLLEARQELDAARTANSDLAHEVAKTRDELDASRAVCNALHAAHRHDLLARINQDNNHALADAVERAIKEMSVSQLKFLNVVLNDDKSTTNKRPLRRLDENTCA